MLCEFENIPCAISGNFTCKICKQCKHEVGMPTTLIEQRWPDILKNIQAGCANYVAEPAENLGQRAEQPALPEPAVEQPPPDDNGPGAQLKKMLAKIGIRATPTCSCNARARYMDFMGVVWCEKNIDTIIGWLKEESDKRRLPFIEFAARALINRAIKLAKKAQIKQHEKQNPQ
jgi:hypothetical protein